MGSTLKWTNAIVWFESSMALLAGATDGRAARKFIQLYAMFRA